MKTLNTIVVIAAVLAARPDSTAAQAPPGRFEIGVQIATAHSSQFDANEVGFGGRFAWRPTGLIGIEAEVDLYPSDFPDGAAFSRARAEGLFGVTAGRTFTRVRPFARLRPGFLTIREAPEPIVCIAIFPPPLSCVLAAGRMLFALDLGGGVEVLVSPNTFLRVDVGDRLLRYPGTVFENGQARETAFFRHDFRLAGGAGLRF